MRHMRDVSYSISLPGFPTSLVSFQFVGDERVESVAVEL